ncbi:MAG: hypothetical protein EOO15_19910 [Chitinophagaceae bacterium]|nr:MAG: hypothetical protein EOO15_19910 [Chitinophagaceae bacterium]
MKKVVLLFAVAALAIGANAQKAAKIGGLRFGIGARVALPMGKMGDAYNIGIGGEAQGEFMFSKASVVGSVGYTTFSGKEQTIGTIKYTAPAANYIPVLVGARYYIVPQFFVGAKVGYAVSGNSGGTGAFNYEPQVGFNTSHFQASVGYNSMSVAGGSWSSLGASLIYKF